MEPTVGGKERGFQNRVVGVSGLTGRGVTVGRE